MPSTHAAPDGAIALTIQDAARLIGTSRSGIYRLANEGTLTPRKLGGRTVILRADLDRLVADLPAAPIRVRSA